MNKIPIIVIVGPTAVGKTALSVQLAKDYSGGIVCGDSMQIYKELEISTAKPANEETDGVPHLLFSSVSVRQQYSVSDYCRDAADAIRILNENHLLPFVVGGTGMYINALVNNIDFSVTVYDEQTRKHLEELLKSEGADSLHNKLQALDPESAEKIHPNNTKRVIRALEIYYCNNMTKSKTDLLAASKQSPYNVCYIGVDFKDRQTIYERINRRAELMIEKGLVKEAEAFFAAKPSRSALQAIGCKEIKPYLDGEKSLDECLQMLKTATRRYAKRQLTWFRRNPDIHWVYVDFEDIYLSSKRIIDNFLKANDVL